MDLQFEIVPSSTKVKSGDIFTVDIKVTPGAGVKLAGVQVDFNFDSSVVQVQAVTEGNLLKQGGAATYFLHNQPDNAAGIVKYIAGVIMVSGQFVSTAGVFATLTCKAIAAGKTSALTLSGVVAGNIEGVAVPFGLTPGQVIILSGYDLSGDGFVNTSDFDLAAAQLGGPGSADFNADGVVNILDLITLVQHFDI